MSKNDIVFQNMKIDFFITKVRIKEGVVVAKQCHQDKIVVIETGLEDVTDCDALINQNKNIKIGVYTADCAPIAYSDGLKIGVAHVGWKGLCLGLAQKMLPFFNSENLEIFVGPHLHVFEIKKDDCYLEIEKVFGKQFFGEEDGKIFFQYKEALASLLPKKAVFDERSTGEDRELPSYRFDKTDERIITVVQFADKEYKSTNKFPKLINKYE